MTKENKTLFNSYFFRIAKKFLIVVFAFILAGFLFVQEISTLIVYMLTLFGLAIYARVNFELYRPYAGIGATLYIFWILRVVWIYAIKNEIGVFANVDQEILKIYYEFLTNDFLIKLTNILGTLAVFLLIFDMHTGIKKIHENSANI